MRFASISSFLHLLENAYRYCSSKHGVVSKRRMTHSHVSVSEDGYFT